MDLTHDVIYRNFYLNEGDILTFVTTGGGIGTGISGCVIENVDLSDVDVVQFMEKRALQSGMDAGDIYLGARRVRLAGTLYGTTRANLFDRMRMLRSALNPVLAQDDEPDDKGFQPIYFSIPTSDTANYDGGKIDLRILAVCRQLQMDFDRDKLGGDKDDAAALPWRATFIARDPRILSAEPQDFYLGSGSSQTLDLINRGDFHASINFLIEVSSTGAGTINYSVGGANNTITVPAGAAGRIFRFNSVDNILTYEEGGIQSPRQDLIAFGTKVLYPSVPHATAAPTGTPHPMTITLTGVTINTTNSHVWLWESYS